MILAVWLFFLCAVISSSAQTVSPQPLPSPPAEASAAQIERGRQLYLKNCFVCHQMSGLGVPGAFPPLAGSDFLLSDRERSIRIVCEGLSGAITVNGKKFDSSMPALVLNDQEVADVLTYARNSWGNSDAAVTDAEVKAVRARTEFPTFQSLLEANTFPALPMPPEGFTLREVVRMQNHGVRMASDGQGKVIYVLCENGDVWHLEPATGLFRQVLWAKHYLDHLPGDTDGPLFVLGLAMDKQHRLYIASNQPNHAKPPFQNRVTIYRSTSTDGGDPSDPKPWFETSYPGNSAFVHGMEEIAFGPDGFLYAGNGARTDANQAGGDTNFYQGGELPVTSCIWRLDPNADNPQAEIFARGIRNAYGFCWNDKGEMFATDAGPDADPPEELNLIERGKHYGFPYKFSNWTRKPYAHTPDPPTDVEFTLPIANLGPDGGFDGAPVYTFDPHSTPGGIAYLGDDFPESYRGTLLLARFGNFIHTPKDNVGFDLLQIRLQKNSKNLYEAHITIVLKPLGRPLDVHVSGKGKVYICEYGRATNSTTSFSLPGRILELAVKTEKAARAK